MNGLCFNKVAKGKTHSERGDDLLNRMRVKIVLEMKECFFVRF